MKNRIGLIVLAGLLVLTACGKPKTATNVPDPTSGLQDAQGQDVAFDVESLRLKELLEDPDPRVKNNAIQAYENLESHNFSKAMYGLTALNDFDQRGTSPGAPFLCPKALGQGSSLAWG